MAKSAEPKTIKNTVLENELSNTNSRPSTPDTLPEDQYELHKDAPDHFILRQTSEPGFEQEHKANTTHLHIH